MGSQAVINVLLGERYKNITKETAGVLKGEYGSTPAPLDAELQARVLEGDEVITCRPADLIESELDNLFQELEKIAGEKDIELAQEPIDDVLTYALFPQVGLSFLENRGNSSFFEPAPGEEEVVPTPGPVKSKSPSAGESVYDVKVDGRNYRVEVSDAGVVESAVAAPPAVNSGSGDSISSSLAGNVFKIVVAAGSQVEEGQPVIVLEAMKMETEISAPKSGLVSGIFVKEGDSVEVGDLLFSIA